MDIIKNPICFKYRTTKDYDWYVPLWVAEELETANAALRADLEMCERFLKEEGGSLETLRTFDRVVARTMLEAKP